MINNYLDDECLIPPPLQRLIPRSLALIHEQMTQEINRKYNEGNQDFTVISCSASIAVTMGFLNPKIILSTGLFCFSLLYFKFFNELQYIM
jgi:hypothetical protein